jgi:FkbM family methyltransferase
MDRHSCIDDTSACVYYLDEIPSVIEYELLDIYDGDVVLDLGGHIGLFAQYAYNRGALRVVSVEPAQENIDLYKGGHLIEAACVGEDSGNVVFLIPSADSLGFIVRSTGRPVKAIRFSEALSLDEFTVVKVDIEHSEYVIDFSLLTDSVQRIAVEFHGARRNIKALRQCKVIESKGFVSIDGQDFDKSLVTKVFERKSACKGS